MEVILLVITAGVIWWWTKGRKSAGTSRGTATTHEKAGATPSARLSNIAPEIKITVTSSVSHGRSDDDEITRKRRDQGPLTAAGPTSWVLNPKSSFPLTLLGADEPVARMVKDLLDDPEYWSRKVPQFSLLIAQHNLRFKELDEWVNQLKPRLEADIAQRIQSSPEWTTASDKDKVDIRAEYQEAALDSLGVYVGHADLATLLLDEPEDFESDDEILRRFTGDPELYTFYLTQLGRTNPVVTAKAEDWGRKSWERLVDAGLALRGKDIPMQLLLEGQRLKDLNELLEGTIEKPIGRKAKALEAVLALPDLESRLSKQLSFRELFQAVPPAGIDIQALRASFGYATQVAQVIYQTYDSASRTMDWLHRQVETPQYYKGWEITNWADPAPACAKAQCRKYKGNPPKFPPFHIGCNCELNGIYS